MTLGERNKSTERTRRVEQRLRTRGLIEYAKRCADTHHVLLHELLGEGRQRPVATARHACWRALHDEAGLSWPMIGEIWEKKSDTVVHATSYRETRAKESVERNVIEGIAAFVRKLGHDGLAEDIEAGAWRLTPEKKVV